MKRRTALLASGAVRGHGECYQESVRRILITLDRECRGGHDDAEEDTVEGIDAVCGFPHSEM